jgi:glucokinase
MPRHFLCADIGATNARFATVEAADSLSITARQSFSSPAFDSVEALIAAALTALPQDYDTIALALPGPVVENCCRVTLLPWTICAQEITAATGIPCILLNDLEAQGWGIDQLSDSDCIALTPQRSGRRGNRCILAPGSDLGEAILYWDGNGHRPFATEGGHCDFAPSDELEWGLCELLTEQYGHARWGDLLSGRGIVSLYRLLADDSNCCRSGEEITELAIAGDTAAREAIERFIRLLGREAANLALKSMAVNGVYIAGGIVPALPQDWLMPLLAQSFDDKPSMEHLLQSMPLHLIRSDQLGILGAARFILCASSQNGKK